MIGSCTGVCVFARACMYDSVIRIVSVNLHLVMSPTGNISITPWHPKNSCRTRYKCDLSHSRRRSDQTSNIWISRFHAGLTVKSCEWRGLRLLTWNPFWNVGYSRENVLHMYGDYCENLLEILVVVMGARRQGALAAARHSKSGIPVGESSHPSWSKETPSPGGVSCVLCSLIKNRE